MEQRCSGSCPDHSRHVSEIHQCQKACDYNVEDHRVMSAEIARKIDRDEVDEIMREVFSDMKGKVSLPFFFLLVSLFVSSLGFQWKNYEQVQRIATDVAVIKAEMRMIPGDGDK